MHWPNNLALGCADIQAGRKVGNQFVPLDRETQHGCCRDLDGTAAGTEPLEPVAGHLRLHPCFLLMAFRTAQPFPARGGTDQPFQDQQIKLFPVFTAGRQGNEVALGLEQLHQQARRRQALTTHSSPSGATCNSLSN